MLKRPLLSLLRKHNNFSIMELLDQVTVLKETIPRLQTKEAIESVERSINAVGITIDRRMKILKKIERSFGLRRDVDIKFNWRYQLSHR